MPDSQPATSQDSQSQSDQVARLHIETRPNRVIVARYTDLPFPNIGPIQEVAFDLGLTAYHSAIRLTGLIFKGYAGHQLLFEQRWPARIIQQHTGQSDLEIPAQTGLAVRHLHFMLHGHELLDMLEITAVGKFQDDEQTTQALYQLPVESYAPKTDLHFPLAGAWWAVQAADWSDHHKMEVFSQTFAIDLVKLGPNNLFYDNRGMQNEDHFSWDQPVYATAGGKVAYVSFDMPDMNPGQVPDPRMFREDARRLLGNAVAISHGNGEFSYYAHLQQASIQVRQGDVVKRGAPIARVGNSGQSPGPHLHFHLMEGPNLFIDRGLPLRFSHLSAGGQYFEQPTSIPTRMIVFGPTREAES